MLKLVHTSAKPRKTCKSQMKLHLVTSGPSHDSDTNYVYIMANHDNGMVKIGRSIHPETRVKAVARELKADVFLAYTRDFGENAHHVEKILLRHVFQTKRWSKTRPDGRLSKTEWFDGVDYDDLLTEANRIYEMIGRLPVRYPGDMPMRDQAKLGHKIKRAA